MTAQDRHPKPPVVDSRIGSVIGGRYRVLERIAEGAMGVVYRGERLGLGRAVAIKFLRDTRADLSARFEIEAIAASRLAHPNCVPVIDVGSDNGAPYLVTDFVDGRTLREILNRGPIAVERALRIIRGVLAGLEHVHQHGVTHRDIKPENILVWSDAMGEHVQIVDFGLAKLDDLSITRHLAVGTPTYMAPEQTLGQPVDARTDVYGVGVLLFELLADQVPFRGPAPFDTMALQRDAEVPRFDDVASHRLISPELEVVVRRALAKRPEDRWSTARAFAAALDEAVLEALDESNAIALPALPAWRPVELVMLLLVIALWVAIQA